MTVLIYDHNITAEPTMFLDQANIADEHGLFDCLGHVINRERSHRDCGQRFHFHTGLASGLHLGGDAHTWQGVIQVQKNLDMGNGQGMTQGDQFGGALGGINAGNLGNGEHIALFEAASTNEIERGWFHHHFTPGNGMAFGIRLGAYINHVEATGFIKMGQLGRHGIIIRYNPRAMELNIAGHQTGNYSVAIPVYEGPLDLLLQLIEHAELDITVVSLAQVTDQYLGYIHQMHVPADEVSAFLVVAAKLIQIKSEALLPRPPVREVGEEDPGESLARQLRIYKRFKELAGWFKDRQENHLRTFLRVASPPRMEKKLDLSGLSLADLMAAAEAVFKEEQDKEALGTVITAPRITIREKIAWLTEKLRGVEKTSFRDLIGDQPDRLDVVVTFLALLELVKRYRVYARQEGLFSDIQIEKLEEWKEDDELEIEFE